MPCGRRARGLGHGRAQKAQAFAFLVFLSQKTPSS